MKKKAVCYCGLKEFKEIIIYINKKRKVFLFESFLQLCLVYFRQYVVVLEKQQ